MLKEIRKRKSNIIYKTRIRNDITYIYSNDAGSIRKLGGNNIYTSNIHVRIYRAYIRKLISEKENEV